MFSHCDVLRAHASQTDAILKRFSQYKKKVPVCGAIVFNSDMSKVLMVRGWGSGASWSFPRGKINQNESLVACAIREVREETGFDMTSFVLEDQYIGMRTKDTQQEVYLFTVPRVPETTEFLPQTRQEISDIKWFFVKDLDSVVQNKSGGKTKSFFLLKPFMHGIRQFSNRIRAQMGLPPLFSNQQKVTAVTPTPTPPAAATAAAAVVVAAPSPQKPASKRTTTKTVVVAQQQQQQASSPQPPQPPQPAAAPVPPAAPAPAPVASWTDFHFDMPTLLACFD